MTHQNETSADDHISSSTFRITEPMLLSLSQTKPWARLLSVLGFISIGFMVIAGIANMVLFSKLGVEDAAFPGTAFVAMNLLMGILYFFPSLFLFRFASSIDRLMDGGSATEMEEALEHQKSFWKFVGVIALIFTGFGILGIVAAIVIPMFAAMNG